jgi:hypothetical protein
VHAVGEDLEESIEDAVPLLGVDRFGELQELFTSANRTVTCLRSPSRALFERRIRSARCFGV